MASIAANNDNDIVENGNNDNDVINNNNISTNNDLVSNNDDAIIIEIDDFMENCSNHEQDIEADEHIEGKHQEETTQNAPNHDIASSNNLNSDTPDNNIDRKLYVGGLNMEITESEIRNYFSVYGNIESIALKPCRKAGKKHGYAFIVFETTEAVNITTAVSNHTINGEPINVQTLKLRHSKIFINLPNELAEEDVKAYFSEFGNIVSIDIPCHKETNERKGYCVITYDSTEVVDEIVQTPIHTINGKEVSIQKSPFMDSNLKNQPNSNRGKKSNKNNKAGGVRSGGKRKAKQNKKFRNRKNLTGQNFNGNSVINSNNEGNNFVEPTFGSQSNLSSTQKFSGRQNFYGRRNFRNRHNFNGMQGFESRSNFDRGCNFNGQQNFYTEPTSNNQKNFDRRPQFYENRYNFGTEQISDNTQHSTVRPSSNTRQNHIEQNTFVGQNHNVRQNFGTEQAFFSFLQTNNNSKANNINVWSSNAQNLSSQSTSNLGYGNNQVGKGNNNYQQGYCSKFATTDGRNAGNTFSDKNNIFGQRHTLENQNNANNTVSRNVENTNSVENQGYNNQGYRSNKFFHSSPYANNNRNNNNERENKNESFGFASGREDIQGNMRSMNGNGRRTAWVGINANINSNDNRRYQPY